MTRNMAALSKCWSSSKKIYLYPRRLKAVGKGRQGMATVGTNGKPEQRTFIDGGVKYADEPGGGDGDDGDGEFYDGDD